MINLQLIQPTDQPTSNNTQHYTLHRGKQTSKIDLIIYFSGNMRVDIYSCPVIGTTDEVPTQIDNNAQGNEYTTTTQE